VHAVTNHSLSKQGRRDAKQKKMQKYANKQDAMKKRAIRKELDQLSDDELDYTFN
jgi:hypothetical protein